MFFQLILIFEITFTLKTGIISRILNDGTDIIISIFVIKYLTIM